MESKSKGTKSGPPFALDYREFHIGALDILHACKMILLKRVGFFILNVNQRKSAHPEKRVVS